MPAAILHCDVFELQCQSLLLIETIAMNEWGPGTATQLRHISKWRLAGSLNCGNDQNKSLWVNYIQGINKSELLVLTQVEKNSYSRLKTKVSFYYYKIIEKRLWSIILKSSKQLFYLYFRIWNFKSFLNSCMVMNLSLLCPCGVGWGRELFFLSEIIVNYSAYRRNLF